MERLLEYFIPEHYQLELSISRKSERITGQVTITGQILQNVVKFHAVDMNIASVEFQASDQANSRHECKYQYDGQTLEISVTDDMRGYDSASFYIQYTTQLNHNMQGCYVSTYNYNGESQKLVATQFESHYAREAFPCIDEPAAKASFDLTLIVPDASEQDVVLANTELSQRKGDCYVFATTPRMSTYLLAWVIGPLQSISTVNQHGVKVTSYCALNQAASSLEFANEVAARALDYYDEKFGIKYPLSKLDQVALPDFEAGAMENWGLVTYRESCMLAEPNASVDTKLSVALTVTHELSHQWFGDLVTMAWWDDLWLNESFATIMEYYATDTLYPELKAWQDFFTGYCVAALRRDCLPGVQAVKQEVNDPAEIATLFDSAIVYAKGARLILMLLQLMGESNFYKGLHEYFEAYQYQNTVGDNLWEKLQKYADFDVKSLMHVWISQPGYPKVWRDGAQIMQERFLIDGSTDDSKWPLPEVKDDMSGHYLIDLSISEFQQKLAAFDTLSNEQKFRLLIDRMLLAKAQAVPSASLLDILPKFVSEDAAVWELLLSIINDLKVFFTDESPEEDLYREFLRHTIHSRAREIGMVSKTNDDSDTKRLRKILAVVARFAHDEEIIAQLAAQYNNNLSQIDAEMRGNILMAKMMQDEAVTFVELLEQYQHASDPEVRDDILYSLSIVKHSANIQQALNLLERPEIVRPQDHLFFYIYLLRNPRIRTQASDWLYQHWPYVEQLTGEKSIEDYPRCMAGYIENRAEAQKFYDFFDQYAENPVLKRTLAMAKVSIEAKLSLIEQEGSAVHQRLQELVKEDC